ncbi:MAG: hypothetical protein PUE95_08095 [Lachnospiraceae bacterium]|nr:hypothetical protein [Lachnospiraceae bacterium]
MRKKYAPSRPKEREKQEKGIPERERREKSMPRAIRKSMKSKKKAYQIEKYKKKGGSGIPWSMGSRIETSIKTKTTNRNKDNAPYQGQKQEPKQ